MLEHGMNVFSKIKNQTEEIAKIAINFHPITFLDIKNQTQELCNLIINKDARFIKYIKDEFKTEELCLLALTNFYDTKNIIYDVSFNGVILSHNLNENIQTLLQFIDNQTEKICKFAVEKNYLELEFVKEQTYELIKLILQKDYSFQNEQINTFIIGNTISVKSQERIRTFKHISSFIKNLTPEIIKVCMIYDLNKKLYSKYTEDDIIDELQECVICQDVKKYFISYKCNKHICCFDCIVKNPRCYYRCNENNHNGLYANIGIIGGNINAGMNDVVIDVIGDININ